MDNSRGQSLLKIFFTALVLLIAYALYQYFVYYRDPAMILKDHSMTTGKLIEFQDGYEEAQTNLTYSALYVYQVDGQEYQRPFVGDNPCNHDSPEKLTELLNYEYPVIYYNPDPNYSRMLTTPEHFKKFKKVFPNSLEAIYQKYWNCD